ncbi:MAG: DNA double-strand break repair nuclease NurA [Methanothrix sp.]|nr:DNA double-strand break repair nuclease NurA [Methanothrix sp.]MDD4446544.1 DNA double-strand break repair nuclease NurA [Methanothrix sp.]
MIEPSRISSMSDRIKPYFRMVEADSYCEYTGISREDFRPINGIANFESSTYAVDGSNVLAFTFGKDITLNYIRSGYVAYNGSQWQKTAITYDDLFLANPSNYVECFEEYLSKKLNINFNVKRFELKETELDRISSYFRDLQEYIALRFALRRAKENDVILYDGGFSVWENSRHLGEALDGVFRLAEDKHVDIIGVSKSTEISWSDELERSSLIRNTGYIGSSFLPDSSWYINITNNRKIKGLSKSWKGKGETFVAKFNCGSDFAFKVDIPRYAAGNVDAVLSKIAKYSGSAECLGYPHALFRAHREIRINDQEKTLVSRLLFNELSKSGVTELQIRRMLIDFHNILEMKTGGIL